MAEFKVDDDLSLEDLVIIEPILVLSELLCPLKDSVVEGTTDDDRVS